MYILLQSLPLPYCPICALPHPRPPQSPLTLFHTDHPLSLSPSPRSRFVPLPPPLGLPPFPNHLTSHRPSGSCPFLLRYPLRFAPASHASFLRRSRFPLVPVPVVDSTSARSRFANIARKRRRRRDYGRIRRRTRALIPLSSVEIFKYGKTRTFPFLPFSLRASGETTKFRRSKIIKLVLRAHP